jgi:hypothetical protein
VADHVPGATVDIPSTAAKSVSEFMRPRKIELTQNGGFFHDSVDSRLATNETTNHDTDRANGQY